MEKRGAEITTIDCNYVVPEFAASFLLTEGNEAAFIENNTAHSVPILLAALSKKGLKPSDVRYVIVTHVHLDHAGGSSMLMKACPNATLLAHPRAAKHLIDPEKLVSSARQVYGAEVFDRLYGTIEPIAESRVRTMSDGETLTWGTRTLTFLHTRGHANHHFCVLDSASRAIFTGDSFGLAYPALQKHGLFIFPSTSPTDFDPVEAKASVERIASCGATSAYLTHFGPITDLAGARTQLLAHLDFSEKLLHDAADSTLPDSELSDFCLKALRSHFKEAVNAHGKLIKMDLQLNADGIAHVAKKLRKKNE